MSDDFLTNKFLAIAKTLGLHALTVDMLAEMLAPELPDRDNLIRVTMREAMIRYETMHPPELEAISERLTAIARDVVAEHQAEHDDLPIPIAAIRVALTPRQAHGETAGMKWRVDVEPYQLEPGQYYYRIAISDVVHIHEGSFEDPGECLNEGMREAVRRANAAAGNAPDWAKDEELPPLDLRYTGEVVTD